MVTDGHRNSHRWSPMVIAIVIDGHRIQIEKQTFKKSLKIASRKKKDILNRALWNKRNDLK